jgi:hypothetical protein
MQPILITTENACALLAGNTAIAADLTADVHTGFDDDTKTAPAIICNAESASEVEPFTGVYRVKMQIIVKEIAADTTNTDKGILANTTFQAFLNSNTISDLINTVSNLMIYDIIVEGVSNSEQGDAWVQTLSLDVIATLTN